MEYNPTVWEENDLITFDRMNKIERGIQDAFEQEPPEGLMPSGGTTGQMLRKASDTDFDAQWVDPPEHTAGVTMEQVNLAIYEAITGAIKEAY